MIPDGWKSVPLSEVVRSKIVYGIVQAGPHMADGVPYLKSSDVGGQIAVDGLQRTSLEIHARYNRSAVRPGDIVISLRGNTGATSIVPQGLPEANLTQGTARISVGDDFDGHFIHQQIAGSLVQRQINAATKGSTFVEITLEDLRKVEVYCPGLRDEQRRIAEILSTWDRAIEAVEALIANACTQKRALMQSLLTGKKRRPGFSGAWIKLRLGDALAERSEFGGDDLPLLSVTQSDGVIHQGQAGRKNISSADQSNYKTVRNGDIAYNTMRMWQGASALSCLHGKVSPAYTIVTPREGYDAHFFAYMFKWPPMIYVFERHSQGLVSDTWNLKYQHFSKIMVRAPLFEEQVAIRRVLEAADDGLVALKKQLAALRQEKSALMQQLLTGKRRVKKMEEVEA